MSTHHSLRFHPEVERDLQNIYAWYEEKLFGLGDDFLQIFYSSIELIKVNPLLVPKTYKKYHRYLLRKFPYALYYFVKDDSIIVMGVFHHSRDPKAIISALGNRTD